MPKSALRQIYNKLHQLFSEEKLDNRQFEHISPIKFEVG